LELTVPLSTECSPSGTNKCCFFFSLISGGRGRAEGEVSCDEKASGLG